jgi:hypothetical protein
MRLLPVLFVALWHTMPAIPVPLLPTETLPGFDPDFSAESSVEIHDPEFIIVGIDSQAKCYFYEDQYWHAVSCSIICSDLLSAT